MNNYSMFYLFKPAVKIIYENIFKTGFYVQNPS